VTQKNDKVFASYIHPKIVSALGLTDKGIKSDGYGMTVYGSLPGVLTESFFITNESEACDFLGAQTHVQAEVQAMYDGLVAYFSQNSGGGRGRR
jgi:N-acetylmuramoyl-L-alanine amidase